MYAGAPDNPVLCDVDPPSFGQGTILAADKEACTIDFQLMEGYTLNEKPGRIELFTPDGVMLPHLQDEPSEYTDLGAHQCQGLARRARQIRRMSSSWSAAC